MSEFTQDYINDKRSLAQASYRAKESAKNNENITDEQSDAWRGWDSAGEIFYADALDEIERLQSQLAASDELIERLVEAGEHPISVARSWEWLTGSVDKWDVAVAEYRASKESME